MRKSWGVSELDLTTRLNFCCNAGKRGTKRPRLEESESEQRPGDGCSRALGAGLARHTSPAPAPWMTRQPLVVTADSTHSPEPLKQNGNARIQAAGSSRA